MWLPDGWKMRNMSPSHIWMRYAPTNLCLCRRLADILCYLIPKRWNGLALTQLTLRRWAMTLFMWIRTVIPMAMYARVPCSRLYLNFLLQYKTSRNICLHGRTVPSETALLLSVMLVQILFTAMLPRRIMNWRRRVS